MQQWENGWWLWQSWSSLSMDPIGPHTTPGCCPCQSHPPQSGAVQGRSGSRAGAADVAYLAAERVIPGYGGGMSSAKAALESDTRVLAYEAGRKWGIRVNTISAGPLGSRAAKAIGFIDKMINYSLTNAPLNEKPLEAIEIGNTAAFLCSPLASAITGETIHVDNGLAHMGLAESAPEISQ